MGLEQVISAHRLIAVLYWQCDAQKNKKKINNNNNNVLPTLFFAIFSPLGKISFLVWVKDSSSSLIATSMEEETRKSSETPVNQEFFLWWLHLTDSFTLHKSTQNSVSLAFPTLFFFLIKFIFFYFYFHLILSKRENLFTLFFPIFFYFFPFFVQPP